MVDTDEILGFQVALAKKVIHKTGNGGFPLEFQLSIYDQINRDLRMNKINNNKNNNNNRKATFKQKKLMDDLNISYEKDVDVKTASRLIGEALNNG